MKPCDHPNINRMSPDNAICLCCGHHWWRGKEYTRKEWDALMDSALDERA